MVRHIALLWQSTDAYRAMYYSQAPAGKRVDHEHRQILAALQDRATEQRLRYSPPTASTRSAHFWHCSPALQTEHLVSEAGPEHYSRSVVAIPATSRCSFP